MAIFPFEDKPILLPRLGKLSHLKVDPYILEFSLVWVWKEVEEDEERRRPTLASFSLLTRLLLLFWGTRAPHGGDSIRLDRAASQWRRWLMEMGHETVSVLSPTTRRRFIAAWVESDFNYLCIYCFMIISCSKPCLKKSSKMWGRSGRKGEWEREEKLVL